ARGRVRGAEPRWRPHLLHQRSPSVPRRLSAVDHHSLARLDPPRARRASNRRAPMKLSVIIPARNEEGSIGPTVDAIAARLAREGIAHEIVVVDDGSADGTADAVRARAASDPSIRLIDNP